MKDTIAKNWLKRRRDTFRSGLAASLAALIVGAAVGGDLTEAHWRVLDAIARARFTGRWPEFTTNDLRDLRVRADAYLETRRNDHQVGGLVVALRRADPAGRGADRYESVEDSATLTGLALMGDAYHYGVTRDPTALRDIQRDLDGLETALTVTGQPGRIASFAGRANDPAYRPVYSTIGGEDPNRPGFGRKAAAGTGTNSPLVWVANRSRDPYAAVGAGLATTWQLVRDSQVRERTARLLEWMLATLETNQWRFDDGLGQTNFVTPLIAAALLRSGATMQNDRRIRAYETRAAQVLALPPPNAPLYADLRSATLNALCELTLVRLEADVSRRLLFEGRLAQLWRESSRLLNPLLAATYSQSQYRQTAEPTLRATLEGVLAQFPNPPRTAAAPGPIAEDVVTVTANGRTWSKFALPLAQQPTSRFQWWQSSCGQAERTAEAVIEPGVDYTLAFWMGRESGAIPSEDAPPSAPRTTARRGANGHTTNAPVQRDVDAALPFQSAPSKP